MTQHELIYTALGPSPLVVTSEKTRIAIDLVPNLKLISSNLNPPEKMLSLNVVASLLFTLCGMSSYLQLPIHPRELFSLNAEVYLLQYPHIVSSYPQLPIHLRELFPLNAVATLMSLPFAMISYSQLPIHPRELSPLNAAACLPLSFYAMS